MKDNNTKQENNKNKLVDQKVAGVGLFHKKNTKENNVYRLALYGVRGSGKTCILAALSLPRVTNPLGYTCTWIEEVPGHEFPTGAQANWKTNDPFHIGFKWLTEQRKSLNIGDIPEPNKASQETMRFLFNFSSRDHGRRQIELIDYSGELLTATASELAKNLRDIMRDCDGLLVLAEVPYPGRDQTSDAENLEKLKGAFSALLEERKSGPKADWPIGLLFNKWDRRMDYRNIKTESGDIAIKAFLAESPQPAQAPLVDMLRNFVGDENLHCLPISAFGAHKIRGDGMEVPETQGALLKSFNLEDGFIWVAQRIDALKVKKLEEASENASWWAFQHLVFGVHPGATTSGSSALTHWFCGVSTLSGISAAWKLMDNLPSGKDLHKKVKNKLIQFSMKTGTQFITAMIALLTIIFSSESVVDGLRYREIVATQRNPKATQGQLESGEEWLEYYAVSSTYRHFLSSFIIVTKQKAHIQLADFQKQRDESAWLAIKETKDFHAKLNLAQNYESYFPNGKYIIEVKPLISEYFVKFKMKENTDYLAVIKNKSIVFQEDENAQIDVLQSLFEDITKLPHKNMINSEITNMQDELREILNIKQSKIVAAIDKKNWETFKETYNKFMDSGNIAAAAAALETRTIKDKNLMDLVDNFIENAPGIIKRRIENAINNKGWQEAREVVKLKNNSYVIKIITPPLLKDINNFAIKIDEAEDLHLYSQILTYKPICSDQVDAYLLRAPLKSMEKEVKEYKDFIASQKTKLNLTLKLQEIQWHKDFWSYDYTLGGLKTFNYDNDIMVTVNGLNKISANKIRSTPNQSSAQLGKSPIMVSLNEAIKISVNIDTTYGKLIKNTFSGGKGEWTGTANELSSSITVDLKGNGFTNVATFLVNGIPPEPELPVWRK